MLAVVRSLHDALPLVPKTGPVLVAASSVPADESEVSRATLSAVPISQVFAEQLRQQWLLQDHASRFCQLLLSRREDPVRPSRAELETFAQGRIVRADLLRSAMGWLGVAVDEPGDPAAASDPHLDAASLADCLRALALSGGLRAAGWRSLVSHAVAAKLPEFAHRFSVALDGDLQDADRLAGWLRHGVFSRPRRRAVAHPARPLGRLARWLGEVLRSLWSGGRAREAARRRGLQHCPE